jgi:hypothetical protein
LLITGFFMNQGKYVIAAMLLVGVVAAGISLWHHYNISRQALEYWGQDGAKQILRAPKVVAVRFASGSSSGQLSGAEERDASNARGLVNIRQALVQDAAYDWESVQPAGEGVWQYALRFEGDGPTVTVLLSFSEGRIGWQGADRSVGLDEASARVLRAFLEEQFAGE